MPELAKLAPEVSRSFDILRRWKDLSKNYTMAHPIFGDYKQSLFAIEEMDKVHSELRSNEEDISHLRFLVESFSSETADEMEEIVDRMENNLVIRDTEVCINGQLAYLQYWNQLIQHHQEQALPLPFEKVRRLALDAYNLLQKMLKRGEDYHRLTPLINKLEGHLERVKHHLRSHPRLNNGDSTAGFIDL